MKAKKRDLVIVGLFTLFLVIIVAAMNSPTWMKWRTLQTCDYTIIKADSERLHFSIERYACPELKCFPQGWNHAFQHDHFIVTMERNNANGEKVDTVEREFVHMEGDDLSIGYEYHPLTLVDMILDDYYGAQEVKVNDDVNDGEISAYFEYPYWGTVRVYNQRTVSCTPSKDPSVNSLNNQGTGKGDTQF